MNSLDETEKIKALDKKNALASISQLPQQVKQAWQEASSINFPLAYKNAGNIVISGMGGSTYGARIVKSLYDGAKMTKIPVELANTYWLPGYVGPNSLIILSSYSGSTKETLTAAKQAKERGAQISGITCGGELGQFLKSNNYPAYIFNPVHNPSEQPRIGVGYMVMGLIGMLARLEKVPAGDAEVGKMVNFLNEQNNFLNENVPFDQNSAKQMAVRLKDKIPVIIVSDFLEGAAYAIRNPFHETAKQFTLHFVIPELNHHLMEGLSYPAEIKNLLHFIFIDSDIYDGRNAQRMTLTKDVVGKNKINFETVKLNGSSVLTQTMELVQLAAWVTFYLAMLRDLDPSEIPWVDYFKKKMFERI